MQDADGRSDLLYLLGVGEDVPPGWEHPCPGPHLPQACAAVFPVSSNMQCLGYIMSKLHRRTGHVHW